MAHLHFRFIILLLHWFLVGYSISTAIESKKIRKKTKEAITKTMRNSFSLYSAQFTAMNGNSYSAMKVSFFFSFFIKDRLKLFCKLKHRLYYFVEYSLHTKNTFLGKYDLSIFSISYDFISKAIQYRHFIYKFVRFILCRIKFRRISVGGDDDAGNITGMNGSSSNRNACISCVKCVIKHLLFNKIAIDQKSWQIKSPMHLRTAKVTHHNVIYATFMKYKRVRIQLQPMNTVYWITYTKMSTKLTENNAANWKCKTHLNAMFVKLELDFAIDERKANAKQKTCFAPKKCTDISHNIYYFNMMLASINIMTT